jgi:hypothetical protein
MSRDESMSRFFCFTVYISGIASEGRRGTDYLILPMPLACHQQERGKQSEVRGRGLGFQSLTRDQL